MTQEQIASAADSSPCCYITHKTQKQTVSAADSTPCQSHYTSLIKCDTRTNSLCSRLPGNTNNVVNSVNIRTFYGENSEAFIAQGNSIETQTVNK